MINNESIDNIKEKFIGNNIKVSDIEYKIAEPVIYYYNIKGKDIRKQLGTILGILFHIPQGEIEKANDIIDILHNTSLVIDDIQDNSDIRRNMPSAHKVYGIPHSISGAYLTLFRLIHEIIHDKELNSNTFIQQDSSSLNENENISLKNKVLYSILDNLYYAHLGQGMDVYYTKERIIPSLEEYKQMMFYKTGLLFTTFIDLFEAKTTNVIAKKKLPNIREALQAFSLFFQIRDDYINIADTNYWNSKGFCQDFDEEKISYIITYCHHYQVPYYKEMIELLPKAKTFENKMKLLYLMYESNIFSYIYKELRLLETKILLLLPAMKSILSNLPYYEFDIEKVNKYIKEKFNIG